MDKKIVPRMMGLGLLLGMVFTAGGELSDRCPYSGKCEESSKCLLYSDSLAVNTLPKYFHKDTSSSICLPGNKVCE